jgi:hypothetical protein
LPHPPDDATVVEAWRYGSSQRREKGAAEERHMNARTLEERVESLEMSIEPLRELPGRVSALESQIVQLRSEMRQEFSAIRSEMVTREGLAAEFERRDLVSRQDLAAEFERRDLVTRQDLAAEFERGGLVTKADLKRELNQQLERFATRDDLARTNRRLRDGFKDLKTQMLVLHEDLVERLKLLSEGGGAPKRARARKRR